ncbi:MAG: heme-binding protein [Nostoc sp. DedQUE05]|uniref:SOUL family heme-binding protein n=1 Tax=Nostoc sp. DedQUE05 TaxID=3075391 RepID=UPI002AD40146|nr:heme-binding protein [Nostoc sp. DedQUE05]MDZ8095358.1 heme-binding protein [Nostoc sp. DedQUE05]
MSQTEEAKYCVLQSYDDIEIRQYEPKIVAETLIEAQRDRANKAAFSILAAYIFGENTSVTKIAMTAPVTQSQPSEKIAMTAPVIQQEARGNIASTWAVQFVMPSEYTLATLPKPKDSRITIKEVPSNKVAAIRFSGSAGDEQLQEKEVKLSAFLAQQGIEPKGKPIYAFYDSPFILPAFRRNEVMLELKSVGFS